jgi:hypothetical protein
MRRWESFRFSSWLEHGRHIKSVVDLRGRPVSLGIPDGEAYRAGVAVLEAFGVDPASVSNRSLPAETAAVELQAGRIQAMFVVSNYPAEAVREAIGAQSNLVSIDGPPADRLRARSGFLYPAYIPAGASPGQTTSIRTQGIQNLLVTRRDLAEPRVRVDQEILRRAGGVRPCRTSVRHLTSTGPRPHPSAPRRRGAVLPRARVVPVSARLASFVSTRIAWVLAVGVCASVALVGLFAFRAVREWERTATLLAERHAQEAADLLALALTRDMRGAQESVLSNPDWTRPMSDGAYDLSGLVASAFARFPYPELFFAWTGRGSDDAVEFFVRADRIPRWLGEVPTEAAPRMLVKTCAACGPPILARVMNVLDRRLFSIFDVSIDDVMYPGRRAVAVSRRPGGTARRLRVHGESQLGPRALLSGGRQAGGAHCQPRLGPRLLDAPGRRRTRRRRGCGPQGAARRPDDVFRPASHRGRAAAGSAGRELDAAGAAR